MTFFHPCEFHMAPQKLKDGNERTSTYHCAFHYVAHEIKSEPVNLIIVKSISQN